jgi:hypothetical protein
MTCFPLRTIAIFMILALLPWQVLAQAIPSPEIEASLYLSRARQELDCSTANAEHWLKQARSAIDRIYGSTREAQDVMAGLRVRVKMLDFDIKARKKAVERYAEMIQKDLREARAQTALEDLARARVGAPTCDTRFTEWQNEATRRKAWAISLDQQVGEDICVDQRDGLNTLRSIRTINLEHPRLESRIREFETAHCGSGFGRRLAKTMLVLGILGAAGYGSYELYQYEEARRGRR